MGTEEVPHDQDRGAAGDPRLREGVPLSDAVTALGKEGRDTSILERTGALEHCDRTCERG